MQRQTIPGPNKDPPALVVIKAKCRDGTRHFEEVWLPSMTADASLIDRPSQFNKGYERDTTTRHNGR